MTVGSIRFTDEERSALIVALDGYEITRCGCAGPEHGDNCHLAHMGWTDAEVDALESAHSRLIQAAVHDPA